VDVRLREIPVIFMGVPEYGDGVAACFGAGGVDYVTEPFPERELLARLDTHIRLHRAYLKLAEQCRRLKELEEYRDTMVHMAVHDMRTPLQSIQGHLEMIEQTESGSLSPENSESLFHAIGATRMLNRLVSEMIDVSRLENLAMPVSRRPVELVPLIYRVTRDELDASAVRRVAVAISSDGPAVFADPDLFGRVLLNLIANALKYSPGGKPVTVGADSDSRGVRVWVRDCGPGIAHENRDRVFAKFGVVPHREGLSLPSSGLGLAFCKLAVEAQGGEIGFNNLAGGGCRFWCLLPAAQVERPGAGAL